jgi:hypothetical protein
MRSELTACVLTFGRERETGKDGFPRPCGAPVRVSNRLSRRQESGWRHDRSVVRRVPL